MNENNKKSPMTTHQAGTICFAVVCLVLYQKQEMIKYLAIQSSDWLMFMSWIGVLALIYVRLKKTHKEMSRERKQLLRLKALEDKKVSVRDDLHARNAHDERARGGGGGESAHSIPPTPRTSLTAREIEVGTRLLDGKDISLSDQKRLGQVQIPGATGRGKTESIILPWMVQDYLRGAPVLLIDGKGDPELVSRFCKACSVTPESDGVFIFDPMNQNSVTINPLASGSAQQITDRIINSFQFDDSYYRSVQADATLTVVSLVLEIEKRVTFILIERALTDIDYLSNLVNRSNCDRHKTRARALIRQKEETRTQNLSGILTQLSPFTTGEMSTLVNGVTEKERVKENVKGSAKGISLMETLVNNPSRKSATLILLPTLVYQEVGKVLGRMILQELAYCVGMRASLAGGRFPFTPVFLDEFSSFAYAGFEQILNKARSSGVALHLSHQSMGDLEGVTPQFAKIINTNTNVKCLLGLNDPDTAEFFARHMGTDKMEKFTERTEEVSGFFSKSDERTGMKSVRETEAYRVHPNILKGMTAGQGVIHIPTEHGPVTEEVQFRRLDDLDLNHFRRAI